MILRTGMVTLCAALVLSCAGSTPAPQDPAPDDGSPELLGSFALSQSGELTLTLGESCLAARPARAPRAELLCDPARRDTLPVVAVTPWGEAIRGTWLNAAQIVFRIDWARSGLDPLAADAAAIAGRSWSVAGARWRPTAAEARQILALAGSATDIDPTYVRGGPAPSLEVAAFEVLDGGLHAGSEATVVVAIANRGPGRAYRVVATTRSSSAALHGHRLGFGMIEPGATKTRRLRLAVPADEPGPDVMLVLELAEGNDFAPPNVSRRITVVGPAAAPILAIRCALPGRGDRPSFNLGDIVSIQCVVDNTGASGAEVGLVTSIADAVVARSPAQPITTAGHATFELRVAIPRELTLDADVEIAVTAQDARSKRSARTSIVGTPRSPKVCAPGQLTRAQYQVKLRELRAAAAAGDLTQAQLDRYDAELVACLK